MSGTILGIDLNGIIDRWALTETKGDGSFAFGHSSIPPVVISPPSKGDKPLSGEQALNAIEGRGWVWPEEAAGPDNKGLCRRLPVIKLLQLMLEEKKKEVEVAKGEFISISQLLASHLRGLTQRRVDTAVVAIPDTADETFQQRIVDSRNETGFDKILLLWRPVASLLAWGQGLATNELEKLQETKTKALVVHLDALGLEVSVLTLDVEESSQGLLLTPVRSRIGRSLLGGQFRVLDFAQQLAENHSKRLLGDSLPWQMMWGCPFIWKGFLGHSESTDLFQNSKGEFVHLFQPIYEVPQDTVDDFIESYEDVLEEFEASELAQVRHVIADGPFLGMTCANNQTMAAILRRIVARGLGGRSSIPFHPLTGLQKDVVGNSAIARGAAIYAWRLAEGLPTYYDFLPQLEISAIVKGKPDFVALVPKQNKTAGGKEFGPYTVEQPFSIPAGLSELEFFIYKEGDQVKHTATKLKEPVNRETAVTLVVRQIPGQGHATVEIHPEQKGVFGPRVLNLDWESLTPTNKDKNAIIKESTEKAGICYPDSAPVETHERMWSASGATLAFEEYLEYNPNSHVHTGRYDKLLKGLRKVVQSKRKGSSLGLREADSQVFSVVSSEGIVPERLEVEGSWFYQMREHKSPQQLLSSAIDKLAHHFDQCVDRREMSPDKQDVVRAHCLTAAWCYSAAPENVVEYLLDYVSSGRKARWEPEALGRCIKETDHLLRFFSILEKHFDGSTYHHNWVKGITQILQFREDSVGLLSDSQALKFTIMALNIIAAEIDRGNLKVKFLWGLQLLMLIFRYRIKHKDFLKSDSPHYGELHQIVKTILNGAIQITEGKNKKARKYIQETIKMLDYKGTNLLIAQELASDMISSKESEEADNLQEDEQFIRKDRDSSRISVEDSLKAFQQAIAGRTSEQSGPGHSKSPSSSDLDPFTRVHSSPPRQRPVFYNSDQQDLQVAPSNYGGTEIPRPRAIKIPLLSAINTMGGEIKLYDAAEIVATHFGMPLTEFQQNPFSTVRKRLLEAMQQAALILSIERCIERSRGLFWKITDKGVQALKRLSTNEVGQNTAAQLDCKENTLTKKQNDETEQIVEYDPSEILVPSGSQIKIPLLRIIREMGGRAEISKVLPYIGRHFKIPVKHSMKGSLTPLAADLLKKTKYAAKLLWYDNYLELLNSNTWRITATGTEFLESCKNRGLGDFSETIQSIKTSQAISKLPNAAAHKELAATSVAESKLKLKAEKIASEDAVKKKETESSHSGSIEIPLPHRIRIPLLFIMYKLGGEIELYQATERIAESFDIPSRELGQSPFSTVEKRLFEAMQESAKLLWKINFIERSRPGFWKITARGINWLKSSGKLD